MSCEFGGRGIRARQLTYTALALALGCPAAFAQESGDGNAVTAPEVSIEGAKDSYKKERAASPKYTEPLRDTPQAITVVPEEVIKDQNATTLRDVLRNVPGVTAAAGEGGGAQGDNLRIRGFAANTDIFVDGMRDVAQYGRDPFNVSSIEVAKGPGSTYSGRGSTGGSVNLVSKAPELERIIAGSVGIGSADYRRFSLDLNMPLGDIGVDNAAFRINGMYQHNDTAERDIVTNERWGIAPTIALGIDTPTRFTLSYFHLSEDNIPDYGHPFVPATDRLPTVRRKNFYGFADLNTEQTDADMITGRLEHDFGDYVTLRNQARWSRNTRFAIVSPPRTPNLVTNTVSREVAVRDTENVYYANQTDVLATVETGPLTHDLVAGFEIGREKYDFVRPTATTNILDSLSNPNPFAAYPGVIGPGLQTNSLAEATTIAFYAFDTIKIGEQFQVSGGLRWDRFDADFLDRNTAVALSRVDKKLSYRVGAVYKPVGEVSFFAAYGTSFNPSAEQLSLSSVGTNAASANLAPEENKSFEAGIKWEVLDGELALNASYFRIAKRNARTRNTADPADILVLDGKQVGQGVDIEFVGNITEAWQILAGYVYLKSEITESRLPLEIGAEFPNTAPHAFNLWTTYELPFGFQVGGGASYLARRFSSTPAVISATNPTVAPNLVPGYWLFDAMIGYDITENISLQVNGTNLGNKLYYDRVHPAHAVPGPGRTVTASLNFRF